jgi:hypothetical protein
VTSSPAGRQRAAEVAEKFPGWIVWTADKGSPVATRSGNQRPPEDDEGTWCQSIIADDWTQLETALAGQRAYDEARQCHESAADE